MADFSRLLPLSAGSLRGERCRPMWSGADAILRTADRRPTDSGWRDCSTCFSAAEPAQREAAGSGFLIINADDWGRDSVTTQRTLDCIKTGSVSSISAMVFMADSERAAAIARERNLDVGLHLNFTTEFSAQVTPAQVKEHQGRLSRYLLNRRFAQAVYNPRLSSSFRYAIAAQVEEFTRLYGRSPNRFDGHHHMHLCANVVVGKMLPAGTIVRRNFTFRPGEKGLLNRLYRQAIDRILATRHHMTDLFFSLPPLEPAERLKRIFSDGLRYAVELETHPARDEEYRFLTGGEIFKWTGSVRIGRYGLLLQERVPG